MKSAIPRKVIDTCRGFEENDWRTVRLWFFAGHLARHGCDLEIIESADESALDTLGEKFFQHGFSRPNLISKSFVGALWNAQLLTDKQG